MGLNIIGIATSIKTENLADIAATLGIEVSHNREERIFEDALSNSIEANEIFLTTTHNGTLLTMGEDIPVFEIPVKKLTAGGKGLKFMIGETSGAYAFSYFENSRLLRSVMTTDEGEKQESGKTLEIEFSGADMTEIIESLMEQVMGNDVSTIEPDAKSYCYKFIRIIPETTEPAKTPTPPPIKKPWWKVW